MTTEVDLQNITLIGKGKAQSTIQVSGSGQFESFDTRFINLFLDINTITDTYALDVQTGSSSLRFEYVQIEVLDGSDSLIDSSSVGATSNITFVNCDQTGGSGTILQVQSSSNLSGSTTIFVSAASGNNLLQLDDWDITIEGAGNVFTSGTITTIPADTIFVYPGMDLQGAVDSLTGGGVITLLPGTHAISSPLIITNDNMELSGYGDASIIAASGFGATGSTIGAIQVGSTDGTSPVDGIKLSNFRLTVASDIHGIRVSGGNDNQLSNVTVQKIAGASPSGAAADIGILLQDGASTPLTRPIIQNSRVEGNSAGSDYFTDGIHVTGITPFGGIFGNGNRISEALIEGNNVDYVRETGYVFVGVDNSSLFNNRVSRMGAGGGGAYGIYMGSITNVNMTANVFSGSLSATSLAIGIDSLTPGSAQSTINSIFANNVVDGLGNGGTGFGTGFQIGAASNTSVTNNLFVNNTINGASAATTIAFDIEGQADNNIFAGNTLIGGGNAWDTGFNFQSTAQDQNTLSNNSFTQVTVPLTDNADDTLINIAHHRDTSDPTVNDDIDLGYIVGSIWVNTSTDESFISVDSTDGAAVWNAIDGTGAGPITGVDSDSFTIDQNDSATSISLVFGTSFNESLTWNNTLDQFEFSNNMFINVSGEGLRLGDGSGADHLLVFDDGVDRSFGWDDSRGALSTFDDELDFRTLQGSTPPDTCGTSVAGKQWFDTNTGVLYICDTSGGRNKWLSTSDLVLFGDESGNCPSGSDPNSNANCNVDWGNGLGPDNNTDLGFYIPFDATVIGYGFSQDNDACTSGSFDLEIWGTNSNANDNTYSFLAALATGLTNEETNDNALNVDIAGDQYLIWGIDNNCGQSIDDWNLVVYLRWRS